MTVTEPKPSNNNIYTTPANGFPSSTSNDTLVHDSEKEYQPPHDYDYDENQDEGDGEVYATTTTISNMAPTGHANSNRSMVAIGSSPLTPRQIKQRNTAKRNSISKTNNSALLNTSTGSSQGEEYFTPSQLRDLAFLQSQKFDADFIKTTNELFNRYPSAKISISVINGNTSGSNSSQVTRQVEIDRAMFDKICAFQAQQAQQTTSVPDVPKPAKVQPPAPIRTTSCLSESACLNNSNKLHQNDVDTEIKSKRSTEQHSSNVTQLKQQFNQPETVKSELERAIENRLRRVSLNSQSIESQHTESAVQNGTNKRNMPRDPPPPIPHSSTCPNLESTPAFPPPPSPKELRRLNTTTVLATASVFAQFSTNTVTNPMNTNNNNGISFSPPPPPPPMPLALSSPPPAPPLPLSFENMKPLNPTVTKTATASNSTATTQVGSDSNESSKVSVKSIVNTYQAQQQVQQQSASADPRMSSDFSALIAKKAAEKRAKFQETVRPLTVNAVTYNADCANALPTPVPRVVIYSSEETKTQSEFMKSSCPQESGSNAGQEIHAPKSDDSNNGKLKKNLNKFSQLISK